MNIDDHPALQPKLGKDGLWYLSVGAYRWTIRRETEEECRGVLREFCADAEHMRDMEEYYSHWPYSS